MRQQDVKKNNTKVAFWQSLLAAIITVTFAMALIYAVDIVITATITGSTPVIIHLNFTSNETAGLKLAPGTLQTITVLVYDQNGDDDLYPSTSSSINVWCYPAGGSKQDSNDWDHWYNTSANYTTYNSTVRNFTITHIADTHAANGTWTCNVTVFDITGLGDSATADFTVDTRSGITLSSTTGSVSGNPGQDDIVVVGNSPQNITHDGNVNLTITIQGTNFIGQNNANWTISVGNLTHARINDALSSIPLFTSPTTIETLFGRGTYPDANVSNRYLWLDLPYIKAQGYVGNVTIGVSIT